MPRQPWETHANRLWIACPPKPVILSLHPNFVLQLALLTTIVLTISLAPLQNTASKHLVVAPLLVHHHQRQNPLHPPVSRPLLSLHLLHQHQRHQRHPPPRHLLLPLLLPPFITPEKRVLQELILQELSLNTFVPTLCCGLR